VGTLFLLTRLLDAGFDLVMGVLVDRTRSPWGKARPYFLFGAVPYGLLCVAVFWSPPLGQAGRLGWAAATFLGLGVMFSIVSIPYNALLPMLTIEPRERLQLGSFRTASTASSVIVVTTCTMPLVASLGGASKAKGFLLVAIVFAVVSIGLVFNLFLQCRERIFIVSPRRAGMARAIGDMLRNRAWVVVFLFTVLNFVRFGAVLSVTTYFAINVLKRPQLISILLPSVSGTLLLGSMVAAPYLRRLGMRNGNRAALAVAVALYLLLPFCEAAPVLFVCVYILASLSLSLTMTAIFAMAAETVDFHELLYGERNEGLLSAGISLATKIGIALGGALTAFGLASAAYDPRAVTAEATDMIRLLYYVPALFTISLQFVCISFYPKRKTVLL
jgi:GPH family glycoside/pentoside/hexuronide:cation symporter